MDTQKKQNLDNNKTDEKRNQEIKTIHKEIDTLFLEMDKVIEEVKAKDYNS